MILTATERQLVARTYRLVNPVSETVADTLEGGEGGTYRIPEGHHAP